MSPLIKSIIFQKNVLQHTLLSIKDNDDDDVKYKKVFCFKRWGKLLNACFLTSHTKSYSQPFYNLHPLQELKLQADKHDLVNIRFKRQSFATLRNLA